MLGVFVAAPRQGVDIPDLLENGVWHAVVSYDYPGYRIAPHVDRKTKAITTLLYLPLDCDSEPGLGTIFCSGNKWE